MLHLVPPVTQITAADIRRAAMDLLARREYGNRELSDRLLRRFRKIESTFEPGELSIGELIEQETAKLQAEGLQSDERLADSLVRRRADRGQGPLKIKAELRARGLDNSTISLALENANVDWFKLVEAVSNKRFGHAPMDDAKGRMRRNRFLQQRGFSFDHISAIDSDRH